MEKTSIEPNIDSKIVLMAFKEVAKGIEPVEVIRKRLKEELGLKLQKQQFYHLTKQLSFLSKCLLHLNHDLQI